VFDVSALASRLATLQQADNFFPGGAVAWSWGLETLFADGLLDAPAATSTRRRRGVRAERCEMLTGFVEGQLLHRWACLDRAFLVAAWTDADDHPALRVLDTRIEALTLASELRQGSRRLGLSMLGVHASLETPGAQGYRASVLAGQAMGHLPIVQGLVWRGVGMTVNDCQLAAAHGLCTGLCWRRPKTEPLLRDVPTEN